MDSSLYEEYNPLDYNNLTTNLVRELMGRKSLKLPLTKDFFGAGVYALFYNGSLKWYSRIKGEDIPIYVGKAVPPGARKGGVGAKTHKALFRRIKEHADSIQSVQNLSISNFRCRFLIVTPLWITMAERFLIEHHQPVWNVCLEGFGIHDPGKGRHQGELSWWDTLHPGRAWAANLNKVKSQQDAEKKLKNFFKKKP